MKSEGRSRLGLVGLPFKLAWGAFVVATPVVGVWLSSSLAVYLNGPRWAALSAGLLLFPLLPLAWEASAAQRRRRKGKDGPRLLKLADRVILRTLFVNVAFVAALLALFPEKAFLALSTRGDWMLEGQETPAANKGRALLFAAADGLEWLYAALHDNPYEEEGKDDTARPRPKPRPRADDEDDEAHPRVVRAPAWPLPAELHPLVASMPREAEASIQSVAAYVSQRETNPYGRLKALHDWVADRIAYDAPALARGEYPPQDAETVFRTRKAVCAGYSKLLVALGQAAGLKVFYVVGDSRDAGGSVGGAGHAWNGVEIHGRFFLIDATWDAGYVEGDRFVKRYRASYFLPPPDVFAMSHFPEDPKWQLLDKPLSRGELMRQPVLRTEFYEKGLELLSPKRSQISTAGDVEIRLENPQRLAVTARVVPKGAQGSEGDRCEVTAGAKPSVRCALPREGTFQVWMYAGEPGASWHDFVGQIEVNNTL